MNKATAGWLIEGQITDDGQTYLSASVGGGVLWVLDAEKAIRFVRESDGLDALRLIRNAGLSFAGMVTEHSWDDVSPVEPPKTKAKRGKRSSEYPTCLGDPS